MKLDIVSFSEDWNNKLSNKIFSTIRPASEENISLYSRLLDETVEIRQSSKYVCIARLIGIRMMHLSEVPLEFLMLDTGYETKESAELLFDRLGIKPADEVLILLFKRQN
jgi:hypothetical protein